MLTSLLMAVALTSQIPEDENSEFQFYLDELVSHELETKAPMSKLILHGLAEAFFDTDSEEVFRSRIKAIKLAYQENPRRAERFYELNKLLRISFEKKLKEAKRQRMIYTGAGALVGAVIGFPIGKAISSEAKILLLTIPIGVVMGAGTGFLLGNILAMPEYDFEPGMLDIHLADLNGEDSED